jgi:hypothetical protein
MIPEFNPCKYLAETPRFLAHGLTFGIGVPGGAQVRNF